MKKSKIAFVCQDCGSEYTKWQGQCHDCNAWNTLKQIQLGNVRSERRREGYAGTLEAVQTLGEVAWQSSLVWHLHRMSLIEF